MTRNEARVLAITFSLTPLAAFTAVLIPAAVFVGLRDHHGNIPGGIGVWLVQIALVKFWPWAALAWLFIAASTAAAIAAILNQA